MTIENNENQTNEQQDQTNTISADSDSSPGSAELTGTDQDQGTRKKTRRGRRGGRRNHRNRTTTGQNTSQQEDQAGIQGVDAMDVSNDPGQDHGMDNGQGGENAAQLPAPMADAGQQSEQAVPTAGQTRPDGNTAENSNATSNSQPARKGRLRSRKKPVSTAPAPDNEAGKEPEISQAEAEPVNTEMAETRSAAKSTGKTGPRQGRKTTGSRSRGRGKTGGAEPGLSGEQTEMASGNGQESQEAELAGQGNAEAVAAPELQGMGEGLAEVVDVAVAQQDVDGLSIDGENGFAVAETGLDEADAAEQVDTEAANTEPDQAEARPAMAARSGQRQRSANKAGAARTQTKASTGRKKMFISLTPGEQVEVALTEENLLLEYYLDMLHQSKLKGNIYKGVVHNIDTNLQAAFVSYSDGKNGFLQIDEIHPEYWQAHHEPAKGKKLPPIQKVLRNGQDVLVQVVKEPIGNKGAFLTTWLSLAGRFLVLTPGQEQIGVSRKVEDDAERARLKELVNGIDPGPDMGVIVRTVSAGTTKTTLRNDLQYLKRLWKDIRKKATEVSPPALIHQEPGLPERAVRDYLTDDVCEIWVDNAELAERIRSLVTLLFPRKKDLVHLHTDQRQSLWERFNLLRQFDHVYAREVFLPSGGRLVFDQTEALMAIDINSGKISGKGNFEAMAYKTNMEAAEAIARHLRLRDIGGQVVIDFIEMREIEHTQNVEKALRQAMKSDRARHDIGHISSFGLLELVRQRMGSSAISNTMEPCQYCGGTGQRRNIEWQAQQCLRDLRRLLRNSYQTVVNFETSRELGMYLLNHKREAILEMEHEFGRKLEITLKAQGIH